MLHNLTSSFPLVASPVTPDLSHSCPMESSVSEKMHKLATKYSLLHEIHQVFVVFANVLRPQKSNINVTFGLLLAN